MNTADTETSLLFFSQNIVIMKAQQAAWNYSSSNSGKRFGSFNSDLQRRAIQFYTSPKTIWQLSTALVLKTSLSNGIQAEFDVANYFFVSMDKFCQCSKQSYLQQSDWFSDRSKKAEKQTEKIIISPTQSISSGFIGEMERGNADWDPPSQLEPELGVIERNIYMIYCCKN